MGIDIPTSDELIASANTVDEICTIIGEDFQKAAVLDVVLLYWGFVCIYSTLGQMLQVIISVM